MSPPDVKRRGDPSAVVPDARPRSYYDQPVLKRPVWTWEIPAYFFAGGLAGASSVLAVAARATGEDEVARVAERVAAGGALVAPVLLISDLGRPSRFYNMLRVFKPTSPMNMGSWILAVYGPAAVGAELLAELDRLPLLRRAASAAAALTGPALVTYTAVLIADTAVPVWHDARRELPFAFAGGAAQSAGAAAMIAVSPGRAGPGRRMLVTGSILREVASRLMDRDLGRHGTAVALHSGRSGWFRRTSVVCSGAATALALTAARRSRPAAVLAGTLGLAGAVFERAAVLAAGQESAADPQATIGPQRRRLDERAGGPTES